MLFGPSYRDKNSGQVTASASINSSALQIGDCIVNVSGLTGQVSKVAVVPCATSHEAEVFAVGKSQPNTTSALEQYCKDAFQTYIGIAFDDSALDVTYIHSPASQPTTDVQCIVFQEGVMVTTTYKDSQQ